MDNDTEILNRLNQVFRDVFEDKDLRLSLDMKNEDIENWTSLSHALLIDSMEKEFNISFEIDEILTMQSVRDIYENILKKTNH